MKKLLLALALFCTFISSGFAQCSGVFGANTACGTVAGGFPGPVPFATIVNSSVPRATVKMQRTNTSGTPTWGAYGPTNQYLTACNTSTTACMQAAIALAFPYASGTTALGYDFEILGGNDPASGAGHNFGGGATTMQTTTPMQFPPLQGAKITIGSISFSGTIDDGMIFDSCEMCTLDFRGAQISYHNLGGNGYAIRIKPTQGTPLDNNLGFSPSKIYGQSINGRMRFDLSGNANANVTNSLVDIDEVNGATLSTGCVFTQDSPVNGQNITQNEITIRQLHGIASGMTAFCDGTVAPGALAVLGFSTYNLTISPDAVNTANGVDTWGSHNTWRIYAGGITSGYTLKFEAGACNNIAYVFSTQATPTITDASGCTGVNANIIFVNGSLTAAGFTGLQITGTQAGAGSNSAFVAKVAGQAGYAWGNTTGAVDSKWWDCMLPTSTTFQCRVVNDANTIANPWVAVTRSTTTVTQVQFPNISDLTSTAHSVALGQASANYTYAANGVAGTILYSSGASSDPAFAQCLQNIQSFITGTGATYTTPSCTINGQSIRAAQLDIELWGGGAGGGGGGTGGGNGGAGNTTSISTFTATGGAINAGAGGTCTGSPTVISISGGSGGAPIAVGTNTIGGPAGSAPHYGATVFGILNGGGGPGPTNSGTGGSGGGSNSSTAGGNGGSGGAYCRTIILTPAATYTYTVAAAAAAGSAGTNGSVGGSGAAGGIIVTAKWQ